MATKKNDIALSFDRAEYYTLQEASEYLNRKHGIDNITPKKLLKYLSKFQRNYRFIGAYTPIKNISLSADLKFDNFRDFERDYWFEKIRSLENMITMSAEETGLLLKLDDSSVREILFFGETTVSEYRNPFRSYSYLFDCKDNEEDLAKYAYSQYGFKDLAILAIYPHLTISKQDDLKAELANIRHDFTYEFYDTDDELSYYLMLHLKFKIDDLVILHKDLSILESYILNKGIKEILPTSSLETMMLPTKPDLQIHERLLDSRTANNASKIISALASELLGMDLTQPYSDESNGKIQKAIERQGNRLGNDTIAYWLKQAHEISK